jgi:hypothetical protein
MLDIRYSAMLIVLILVSLGYTMDKWMRKIHESLEGIREALKKE